MNNIRKRMLKAVSLIIVIFLIGTLGFKFFLTPMSLLDSFYLTVVTLTTVGYGDISPHTNMPPDANPYAVKLFTVTLILFSMGALLNAVGIVTEYIVSGELKKENYRKKMQKKILKLSGHFIICGGNETGLTIMDEMVKTNRSCVLIEESEEIINNLQSRFKDMLFIHGTAMEDENLRFAGIDKASGIITTLPDEKDNMMVVISANQERVSSNRNLKIAAKVDNFKRMSPKLKAVGADYVISPNYIGGRRMVSEMFTPSVTTFLDRMLRDRKAVIRFEEAIVTESSSLNGLTLLQSQIPKKTGLLVLAIRKYDTTNFIYCPKADMKLETGDAIIVIGETKKIGLLKNILKGSEV